MVPPKKSARFLHGGKDERYQAGEKTGEPDEILELDREVKREQKSMAYHKPSSIRPHQNPTGCTASCHRMRKMRDNLSGEFKTRQYSYGGNALNKKKARVQIRRVQACAKCFLKVVHSSYEDVLKLPFKMGIYQPRPALFWEAGPNMYFGKNKGREKNKTVLRFAYATGSGTSSIGINPEEFRVYPWCKELDDLWESVKPCLPPSMKAWHWNAVSCKFYDSYREIWKNGKDSTNRKYVKCGLHRDVQWTINGGVADESSQLPGTPVVIVTLGGKKKLSFKRKIKGLSRDESTRMEDYIQFLQTNSSCIVLHPDDEKWTKRPDHLYQSFHHQTEFSGKLAGENTMVATIMFRRVQKTVRVETATNLLSGVSAEPKLTEKFAKAKRKWESVPKLKAAHEERFSGWKRKLMDIVERRSSA